MVHPGSSRDGEGARVGSGSAILHRSGGAGTARRHPETRAASSASVPRSRATCDHLVFIGRLAADRACRLAAHSYASAPASKLTLVPKDQIVERNNRISLDPD